MVAGLASSGVDVLRLGVVPTPAVAYLTAALDAELGVMLSASHNPAPDNGIKLFALGGLKLPDAVEDEIELRLRGTAGTGPGTGAGAGAGAAAASAGAAASAAGAAAAAQGAVTVASGLAGPAILPGCGFGRVRDAADEVEAYLHHLLGTVGGHGGSPLAGLRIVVDCAHGAASELAPRAAPPGRCRGGRHRRGARRAEHQ